MIKRKFNSLVYFQVVSEIVSNIAREKKIQKIIKILLKCWEKGGTVFIMGCGGSASTASHFAADLAKTTIVKDKPRFKVLSLVDNTPLISAWANDYGWETVFKEQLDPWLGKKDVMVGFSVHGGKAENGSQSENLVAAMKLAKERKASIIGFSGFDGGEMKKMADVSLAVPITSKIYGTPVIEAIHIVIHHAIIFELRERIKNVKK